MQLAGTDIRLLRVFDAVVRNESLAAAQSELNVSLSTISSQIASLELRLGFRLCERGRAGFRLTERGQKVSEMTTNLLQSMDLFVSDIAEIRGDLVGNLRLGVVDCVVSDTSLKLDTAISSFAIHAPMVRLELQQGSPQAFQSQVMSGALDLAIGSFPSKVRGIEYSPLYSEANTLYCSSNHTLFFADLTSISADQIRALPVVGRSYWPDDHENNALFRNTCAVTQSVEQQLLLIRSGAYVGFLPDHLARPLAREGKLRQIRPDVFSYTCSFDAIFRPSSASSEKLRAFLKALKHAQGHLRASVAGAA